MKQIRDQRLLFFILLVLSSCILLSQLENNLLENAALASFTEETSQSDGFRRMAVDEEALLFAERLAQKKSVSKSALLASLFYDRDFSLEQFSSDDADEKNILSSLSEKQEKKESALEALAKALEAVWEDVRYFPVPESSTTPSAKVTYENSWMWDRTYGGKRGHEGTDLMASINERGRYPVISMTDGTVENVGWLPKGGYRIGIRSPHGGYFYYAHLSGYARAFAKGDPIKAGELLGLMGDTGYSQVPGTTGMFDVHLHVGIYIRTSEIPELSVNPYYVLRFAEKNKRIYEY